MTDRGPPPPGMVKIALDDIVILLGLLELLTTDVDPNSDLAYLVHRTAARLSARADEVVPIALPQDRPG